MRNCARRWSTRRQQPKCSASSAARPRTCSRCSTPLSRAPRGFVESMTWYCDSARGTLWFRGLILVRYPLPTLKISIDEPRVSLDARAWHTSHSRHPRAKRISNVGVPSAASRTFLVAPLRQQGEFIGTTERASHRGAPLHAGADQAPRNLCRPGRDRDRKCPVVPRTQGIVGAANGDE